MFDILVLAPPDKKAFADHVTAALQSVGYAAATRDVTEAMGASLADAARGAAAAILVWSRPLAASATTEGWLAPLRQRPNLLEVSADGIAPQGGDETRVILLSGWRGQAHHLGWQRVLAELKRICGSGHRPPKRVPAADPGAPAAPADRARPAGARRFRLALAAFALVAAVTVLAFVPGRRPAAEVAPRTQDVAAPARVAAAPAAPDRGAEPAPPSSAPAVAAPPSAPVDAPLPQADARPGPARVVHASALPGLKRYSRRNSKTMRLFCARSGRSTPQCRIFLRSMAAARR
ncbi:MAG: hypothetical protein JO013_11040 [Alphaproteobacteria bacterium]|nr:hypothetical protein [Alphaproteobacteria bacterium]